MLDFLVSKIVDLIQKRDFLNVIMNWIQEVTKRLIEDQSLVNFNQAVNFVEALRRLSEDFNGFAEETHSL